ncbi:MAG TPA: rhomboid family intramembrane serine protease [Verrucomicrobiae bacterium]|nr:rhomboid family intramembrane serine protease [Verrucomicrobiae bacterium]
MIILPIKTSQARYTVPVVTIVIILLNVLVFVHQVQLEWLDPRGFNQFMRLYSLRPASLIAHPSELLTSMFLHAGILHILGNMLFLWVFGTGVEDVLGHFKYLIFYLVCGVIAGLSQVAVNPFSHVPMLGASGAIAGVMGAYLVKFPRSSVVMLFWLLFVFTFDLPAWAVLVYWFLLQLFNGVGSIGESQYAVGGTAFFAHIGGFVAGLVLMRMFGPRERRWRAEDYSW